MNRKWAARAERVQAVGAMRMHDGREAVPFPGILTARQAAERLGVSTRTIQRYKRELRERAA